MIPEWLVFFPLPILLSFSAVLILIKSKTFNKLETLEKLTFSLALGSAIFIFFLSLYGIFIPAGFKVFSLILFSLGSLTICLAGFSYRKEIWAYLKSIFYQVKKAVSDPIKLLFLVALITYFAKIVLFLVYKPIIDPDVVDSYLPFARSTFLADNIPLKDFFSGRPITIPPVGGFILFAWSYALTGSMFSESFRLIPLPFIVGNVVLVYLIGRKALGKKIALLSSIIFMFLPFQDEAFFLTVYYPDTIFLFFCLFFLYLLIKVFWETKKALSNNIYLFLIGLSIATTFLLKLQAIFLYLFLVLIFISHLRIPPMLHRGKNEARKKPAHRQRNTIVLRWGGFIRESRLLPIMLKRIAGILFIVSFFIAPFIIPWLRPYGIPSFWPSIVLTGLMVLFFLFYLGEKFRVSDRSSLVVTCKNIVKVLVISSIGGIWLLRSQAIFHHPIADFSTEMSKTLAGIFYRISQDVDRVSGVVPVTKTITWPDYPLLSIFYWPILGTFWLVPKFWGLFSMLRQKRGLFLLIWGLGWFCFWQIYLGGISGNRYLLPLIPVLAWAIAIGVEELSRKFKAAFLKKRRIVVDTIIAWMIIFGLLFNLLQSNFLWWNTGVIYYGQTKFRNQALEVIPPKVAKALNIFGASPKLSLQSYKDNLIIFAKRLAVVFSASSDLAPEYTMELVLAGLLVSLAIFLFLLAFSRVKLSSKILSKSVVILGVILILPYFLVFMLISRGNLSRFAKLERERVYSSWGQAKFIEPFLIKNAQEDDKVLFFGMQTGLSYYTGLKVYNLEYDIAWLEFMKPIIDERDKEKASSFLKEGGMKYIVVDTHGKSAERFTQFKKIVQFLAILDDKQYVEQKIFPSEENTWALYELK